MIDPNFIRELVYFDGAHGFSDALREVGCSVECNSVNAERGRTLSERSVESRESTSELPTFFTDELPQNLFV